MARLPVIIGEIPAQPAPVEPDRQGEQALGLAASLLEPIIQWDARRREIARDTDVTDRTTAAALEADDLVRRFEKNPAADPAMAEKALAEIGKKHEAGIKDAETRARFRQQFASTMVHQAFAIRETGDKRLFARDTAALDRSRQTWLALYARAGSEEEVAAIRGAFSEEIGRRVATGAMGEDAAGDALRAFDDEGQHARVLADVNRAKQSEAPVPELRAIRARLESGGYKGLEELRAQQIIAATDAEIEHAINQVDVDARRLRQQFEQDREDAVSQLYADPALSLPMIEKVNARFNNTIGRTDLDALQAAASNPRWTGDAGDFARAMFRATTDEKYTREMASQAFVDRRLSLDQFRMVLGEIDRSGSYRASEGPDRTYERNQGEQIMNTGLTLRGPFDNLVENESEVKRRALTEYTVGVREGQSPVDLANALIEKYKPLLAMDAREQIEARRARLPSRETMEARQFVMDPDQWYEIANELDELDEQQAILDEITKNAVQTSTPGARE